jgi:hypothetical protein
MALGTAPAGRLAALGVRRGAGLRFAAGRRAAARLGAGRDACFGGFRRTAGLARRRGFAFARGLVARARGAGRDLRRDAARLRAAISFLPKLSDRGCDDE